MRTSTTHFYKNLWVSVFCRDGVAEYKTFYYFPRNRRSFEKTIAVGAGKQVSRYFI